MPENGDLFGPLIVAESEVRYPWKNTDNVMALTMAVVLILLLICSPAIVVGAYRWLW
jgi:hypothetical protein